MPLRLSAVAILIVFPTVCAAAEPLHSVIDRELKAAWAREKIAPAPRSTDSAFLRRVYLDLLGTIPTYQETTAFLADTDAKKREKLIDKLLADPRFATGQAQVWDQVLFGRHPANYDAVHKRPAFQAWLAKQFAENVPYDRWVKELLLAETPGSEMFYVQFRGQPEEMTVAISKLFLGTQLQCARCHDHPYEKWTQKDFYGLTGFFVRLVVQESGSGAKRTFTIGEKSTGEVLFSGSVKEQRPGKKGDPVKPKFLGGRLLDEPPTPRGFKEPKNAKSLPKPAFSRKARLAEWVASRDNPYLAKAVANRVWAQFMGRGLIHPIDDIRADSKASHPALQKALTDGLVEHRFDLKWLIREIVLSDGYQLAMHGPSKEALPKWFEQARIRPLSAEELVAAMRLANMYDQPGDRKPEITWDYFTRFFGDPVNGLGDFQGSLNEHLFWNNSEHVRRFIQRKKGNLIDTMLASKEPVGKRVEHLFLAIYQRLPNPTEADLIGRHLQLKDDKPEALYEEAIWALLNSSEFRFNH
ncbi:MAG TPA: DUF1549 domain-containing protein [Gemmataceae bacterium]|jgi:hypothetical protein